MNLRQRTLLASSIATVILVMGLSVGLSYLILQQISLMEAQTMDRRLDRTFKSLLDDLGVALDVDRSAPTAANHSSRATRETDIVIVLDEAGKPITGDRQDSMQRANVLPSPSLQATLAHLPPQWVGLPTLESLHLPQNVQVGLLQTREGLLLLVDRHFSQESSSQHRQPHHPYRWISGQWLRPERLRELGDRTLLRLNLLPLADAEVPAQLKASPGKTLRVIADYFPKKDVKLERPKISTKANIKYHAGYALLQDVNGKPIAVLQAISPKPFAAHGEEGVRTLLAFLWLSVLLFGIILNLLLDRWVLSRIANLSHQLNQVKADFSHASPVILPGKDELSDLATDINAMLQRLEDYQENLRLANVEIEAANRELERLAATDGLTQVMNRRFFQIHLKDMWQATLEASQPLSLLLCDVDFFKPYNDTYGHLAGDLCLQKVAKAMSTVIEHQPSAIMARYGGEEFAAIMANVPLRQAIEIAEQMRVAVMQLNIPHAGSKVAAYVTLSIGICILVPQPHLSERDLIARADERLYQAKTEGRNRVIGGLFAIDTPDVMQHKLEQVDG